MRGLVPTRRALRVWQRNFATYRHVWRGNLLGHLADPLFYLAVLGFGLGSRMQPVQGVPYVAFLASGVLAGAAMSSACFETSYASFLRMRAQRTFDAILATPLQVADIAGGEVAWAATKGLVSASATFLVAWLFGLLRPGWWLLPAAGVVLLQGLFFGGVALSVTARVRSLEALNHFYALFIMPVLFLSGVFFPLEVLPTPLWWLAQASPLTHAVHVVRPLATGEVPQTWVWDLLVLGVAAAAGVTGAAASLRRAMLR